MNSYTKMSYKKKSEDLTSLSNKMFKFKKSKNELKKKNNNSYYDNYSFKSGSSSRYIRSLNYNIKVCFMVMLITLFIAYMSIRVLELYGIKSIAGYKTLTFEEFKRNINDKFLEAKNKTQDIYTSIDTNDTNEKENIKTDMNTSKSVNKKEVLKKAYLLFKSGSFEMLGVSKNSSLIKIESNDNNKMNEPIIYKSDIKKAIYGNSPINIKLDNIENISNDVIEAFKNAKDMPSKNNLINAFFKFETPISKAKEEIDYHKVLVESNEKVELDKMKILIFHTHSQETYEGYDSSKEGGVIYAGELLGKELKDKYGFEVIHYTGEHDLVDGKIVRDGSYERIEDNIKSILEANKDIMLAIDLHRDGVSEDLKLISEIDEKKCAQIMLVNGISMQQKNGALEEIISLKNEYLYNNLNLSMNMHMVSDYLYPKLSRKILVKPYRYSLHMLPNTALIELGAQNNTIEEVENTIPYLAEIIAKTLYLKSK